MEGTIRRLMVGKGFGFARPAGGSGDGRDDHFFHYSDLASGLRFDDLTIGARVTFESVRRDKGLRATQVMKLEEQ